MPDEVQYLHFNNENITNVQFSVCDIYIISRKRRPTWNMYTSEVNYIMDLFKLLK